MDAPAPATNPAVYCANLDICRERAVSGSGGGTHEILCELDQGGILGGTSTGVTEYPGSPHQFSFWGEDNTGQEFCCVADTPTTFVGTTVTVIGTQTDDTLSWHYSGGGTTAELSQSTLPAPIEAHMYAEAGEDTLVGPTASNDLNAPWFWGGSGNDDLDPAGTAVSAIGGFGDDHIECAPGATCNVFGDRWLSGTLGGEDTVIVDSASGQQFVFSGPGDDTVCLNGGLQVEVWGGAGDDLLVTTVDADPPSTPGWVFNLVGDGGADECTSTSNTDTYCKSSLTVVGSKLKTAGVCP